MSQFATAEFKKKLDDIHDFPTVYMFKFIVTEERKDEVQKLFPSSKLNYKPSSKGKYTSVTASIMMQSSDHVIKVYQKAQTIEGIIAL